MKSTILLIVCSESMVLIFLMVSNCQGNKSLKLEENKLIRDLKLIRELNGLPNDKNYSLGKHF